MSSLLRSEEASLIVVASKMIFTTIEVWIWRQQEVNATRLDVALNKIISQPVDEQGRKGLFE